jgi:hypothetical protein
MHINMNEICIKIVAVLGTFWTYRRIINHFVVLYYILLKQMHNGGINIYTEDILLGKSEDLKLYPKISMENITNFHQW